MTATTSKALATRLLKVAKQAAEALDGLEGAVGVEEDSGAKAEREKILQFLEDKAFDWEVEGNMAESRAARLLAAWVSEGRQNDPQKWR